MTANSDEALMDILLRGDKYLLWLPYSNTVDRAKLYLKDGRPFTEIDNGDRSIMKTISTIRNAIAHTGPHATGEFEKVISSLTLLRGESETGRILAIARKFQPKSKSI
jgi:hypothetical protein